MPRSGHATASNSRIESKTALTSGDGAIQIVLYASTMGRKNQGPVKIRGAFFLVRYTFSMQMILGQFYWAPGMDWQGVGAEGR